jgi:hypothetical protein
MVLDAAVFGVVYVVPGAATTQLYYQRVDSKEPPLQGSIPVLGTAVVGDFLPTVGEEVAIHSGDKLYIHDRATSTVVERQVTGGIPVDEININSFSEPTSPPTTPPPSAPPAPPAAPTDPGLASVCASSLEILPGELLVKSEPSNHIGRHDPRTQGYTVVCAALCPQNLRYTPFYYANGELAGAVAIYGRFSGNGQPRLYGAVGQAPAHNAKEIAKRATTIGNGKLYLQMSAAVTGEGTTCKEFFPSGRNGSL